MAIRLTPPSPGRIIFGPRGGRRRVTNFQVWLAHASGTPTFSTRSGASGNAYPVMRILLTDGNHWNYVFPSVGIDICAGHNTDWTSVVWTPHSLGSGGVSPTTGLHPVITTPGTTNFDFSIETDMCFGTGTANITTIVTVTTSNFPLSVLDVMGTGAQPDITSSAPRTFHSTQGPGPLDLFCAFFQGIGWAGSIDCNITVTGSDLPPTPLPDFWQKYKIFRVPGYPGQWFGEWFNAVAWGNELGRFTDSDLVTWLGGN